MRVHIPARMPSSPYPLPDLIYDQIAYGDGEGHAKPLHLAGGVYATGEVSSFEEDGGRLHLAFPVEPAWLAGDGLVSQEMPWPKWRKVEFRPREAVRNFLRVRDAPTVLRFAKKYGPLWSCPIHSFQPAGGSAYVGVCLWSGAHPPDVKGERCSWSGYEPVDWWLHIARTFRTTLEMATLLRDDKTCSAAQWRVFGLPDVARADATRQRAILSLIVSSWLKWCPVTITLDPSLKLELFAGLGFLPPLWHQAAAMVGGGAALAICSSCGRVYARQVAPKRGQGNYCRDPRCGDRASKRESKRRRAAGWLNTETANQTANE